MKIPNNTKLLITGAPRSGTHFTARLLFNLGLDIRHETVDTNGTVSSVHTLKPSGFTKVVHQIRDPLKSISSLHKIDWLSKELWLESMTDENFSGHFKANLSVKKNNSIKASARTWVYFLNKIKDRNLTRKCMKAYLYWNELSMEVSEFTYRLEGVLESKETFNLWLESLGLIPEDGDYELTGRFVSSEDITNSKFAVDGSAIGGIRTSPELSNKIKKLSGSFYK